MDVRQTESSSEVGAVRRTEDRAINEATLAHVEFLRDQQDATHALVEHLAAQVAEIGKMFAVIAGETRRRMDAADDRNAERDATLNVLKRAAAQTKASVGRIEDVIAAGIAGGAR